MRARLFSMQATFSASRRRTLPSRLSAAPERPRRLIGGTSAAATTFKAPAASSYVFQFAATGGAAAASASRARRRTQRPPTQPSSIVARRLLNARDPDRLRIDRAATPIMNADKPLSSTVAVDDDGQPKDVEFSVSFSEISCGGQWQQGRSLASSISGCKGACRATLRPASIRARATAISASLYLGTRSMIGPDIMLGALAQLDRGVESSKYDAPEMAAKGWMAGPYMSCSLAPASCFDGRAAWGETENAVASPDIDDSLTARRLVRGKLTGTRELSAGTSRPASALVYVEDAVRDSASGEARAAGTGKVEVLPEVSKRFAVDDVTFIEPRAARRRLRRLRGSAGAQPLRAVCAAHRCAIEGGSGRRLRREGWLEPAGDGRRRERDDDDGAAELDRASAAQRSAWQMRRFAAQQVFNFVNIFLTPMQRKVISRVTQVTYSALL